ncbi:SHOCT-like domain-containing protein [Actinomadura harenae]|uniref:YvlB/LiaX N-terminal domain-containing protein n=1 Tax=Actinomadura harenae TaxID=2483351 RepID=A0A3M2M633_9ACTN|nr:hypothetical protein [Actinomadura harenae]RMI43965.1 hypothetical protein EBO15_14825 [Actinomadura harenae]
MNDQGRQILQMLGEGKITADEAERLIDALGRRRPEPEPGAAPSGGPRPKYLRVVVKSTEDPVGPPTLVNIRVPLQLLRAGVRLASLIPPQALTKVNEGLEQSGVPIDLTQLKPQDLEELIEHLGEVSVDIDDPTATVQVFCE